MKQYTRLLVLSFALFASCANIVAPSGGPQDVTPPQITRESPENFTKNFNGNSVVLEFDEYVKLNNPSQEIVISPAIEPEPEFSLKGKRLTITWKASLDSATTYTIAFGEALKDANESNTLSGFKYVFSTGAEIDSLFVKGKAINAKDDKPAAKVLVMLHQEFADSAIIKKKPYYFTKTDDGGNFSLENIRAGKYRIFALKDENFNYLYDLPNEEIAFRDTLVEVNDSTDALRLFVFKENRPIALKYVSKDESKNEYVKLIFSGKTDSVSILALSDLLPVAIPEYNATKDTVTLWYSRIWQGDSIIVRMNGAAVDTPLMRNKPASLDAYRAKLSKLALIPKRTTYGPSDTFFLMLNRPVLQAALENIVVTQDSPEVKLDLKYIRFSDTLQRKMALDFARSPGTRYTVLFPPGTFTDHFGITNDSLTWNIETKSEKDFGALKLTVSGQDNKQYIIQLLDGNGAVQIERTFTGNNTFQFDALAAGSYQPVVITDKNGNGKWDTGNYLQHVQPEKTYRHPEPIVLRANWEMEVELKVK